MPTLEDLVAVAWKQTLLDIKRISPSPASDFEQLDVVKVLSHLEAVMNFKNDLLCKPVSASSRKYKQGLNSSKEVGSKEVHNTL